MRVPRLADTVKTTVLESNTCAEACYVKPVTRSVSAGPGRRPGRGATEPCGAWHRIVGGCFSVLAFLLARREGYGEVLNSRYFISTGLCSTTATLIPDVITPRLSLQHQQGCSTIDCHVQLPRCLVW